MEQSRFKKVLGKKDIYALAFGAIIGWGWVVLSGVWIETAGTLGAMLAFAIGGTMVVFVGLTYAELTSAMPKCGGEQVFSLRALGRNGSFICTWFLVLGYIAVPAFEACALPGVAAYIIPNFSQGYLYSIAGFDVYLSWILVGTVSALLITLINYIGVRPAAFLQGLMTLVIIAVGIMLLTSSFIAGDPAKTLPLFEDGARGVFAVTVSTPFFLMGFDVVPQVAEEMRIESKKIGKILLLAIIMGALWYVIIILSVSLVMTRAELDSSALATADALKNAWNGSNVGSTILIFGGIAGIVSSWNAFIVGGSRCIFAMAESGMLPKFLARLHPKYKTPCNAILLVGLLSSAAPFFGKAMLGWLSNAGSFAVTVAYMIVSLSFLVLRRREPDMPRPYRVKRGRLVGLLALAMTMAMLALYLPGLPSGMQPQEWTIVLLWAALGVIFFIMARLNYTKS